MYAPRCNKCVGKVIMTYGCGGSNATSIIIERYQYLIKKKNMVDKNQNIDCSSSFFEGRRPEIAEYGYSRDHRSDKKQITYEYLLELTRFRLH